MPVGPNESGRRTAHTMASASGAQRPRKKSASRMMWLVAAAGALLASNADANAISQRKVTVVGYTTTRTSSSFTQYPFHARFLRDKTEGTDCEVVEECQLCDASSRAEIPQCAKTGRVERWRCNGEQEEGTFNALYNYI